MNFPVDRFKNLETPFYYYDVELLEKTIAAVRDEAARYGNFDVHYAIKANFNPRLLEIIAKCGLGADCVSGGEVDAALKAGVPASKIVFAGVGKTDKEIAEKKKLAETIKKAKEEGKKIEYIFVDGHIKPVIVDEKPN